MAAIIVLFPNVAAEGVKNQDEKKVAEAIYQVLDKPEEVKEFPKPSTEQPKEETKPILVVSKPVEQPVTLSNTSCDDAVRAVWPQNLWYGAGIVLDHENHSRNPRAIGGPNPDGSFDYGCFQINRGLQYYGEQIFDPVFNAKIAYGKYQSRGFKPWYAVCPLNGSDPYGLCY